MGTIIALGTLVLGALAFVGFAYWRGRQSGSDAGAVDVAKSAAAAAQRMAAAETAGPRDRDALADRLRQHRL